MFKLTIEDDEGKTTVVPLIRDEMTIGRDDGNTIRLTDRNVSRRHARLMRQNGSIFVEDLKSFTGVRVNGNRIAALTSVAEGDQVQIGDYKLRLKTDRPAAAEPTDRPTRQTMSAVNGSEGGAFTLPTAPRAPTPASPAAVVAVAPAPAPAASPVPAPQPNTSVTSMGRAVTPRPSPTNRSVVDLLPAPDPIEAQPTIPLRMLSEMDGAENQQPARPARLVVLTTELAGKEFLLERASLVIGRTSENDVVLNHRSISRHHAKIVQDRDRVSIVDLQSANGVRVNGEDYERIELHAGDVVELGHVRMRYVGPAEHFVFDPAGVRAARLTGPARAGLALAGVALAAVTALIVQRAVSSRGDEPAETRIAAAPAAATAAAPATPPAAAPAARSPADDLLAQAGAQAKSESWDAALATLDQLNGVLAAAPADSLGDVRRQTADLRRSVEGERRNAIAFARFEESAAQKNYAAAIDWYGELPQDSPYKKRAQAHYDETRTAFVAAHLQAAEKLRLAGRCTDLRQEIDLIQKVDPQNAAAEEKLHQCRTRPEAAVAINNPGNPGAAPRATAPVRPVAAPQPRPAGPAATTAAAAAAPAAPGTRTDAAPLRKAPPATGAGFAAAPPAKKAAEAGADGDAGDADVLIKQARDAWLKQQCGSAIDLSRKAIRARPGMVDAYQVIAVCSCSLKDAEGATRAYAKLDEKSRNLVRTLCQRNGIAVSAE